MPTRSQSDQDALRVVRVVHTVVWAEFAGCIFAIPVVVWRGHLAQALVLIAVVFVEVFVLAANRFRCPLTDVAARFTDDRADNVDISLPLWLARYNQVIFGSLFAAGMLFTLARWQ